MRLIITSENQVVAVVENYEGPVPRKGESVHCPGGYRTPEPVPGLEDAFMTVKSVSWGIIARPRSGKGCFTGAAEPFVEVIV